MSRFDVDNDARFPPLLDWHACCFIYGKIGAKTGSDISLPFTPASCLRTV